jgi:hypothetical protein
MDFACLQGLIHVESYSIRTKFSASFKTITHFTFFIAQRHMFVRVFHHFVIHAIVVGHFEGKNEGFSTLKAV